MELNAVQIRVLGCLVEKESTTPDNYPLSSNALVNACNQSSNRDPVVSYEERLIDAEMLELRLMGLARTVTGGRANKHRHVLDEAWGLTPGELAVLAVLFLRGGQTGGELRTRTERLHHFGSVEDVDSVLGALAARSEPFVEHSKRRPGQKEGRWGHLLADDSVASPQDPERSSAPSEASLPTQKSPASDQAMRSEVDRLRADVDRLYELLGETPDSR